MNKETFKYIHCSLVITLFVLTVFSLVGGISSCGYSWFYGPPGSTTPERETTLIWQRHDPGWQKY
jgi:hypothetical protein